MSPFSFAGKMGRVSYTATALAAFFSQHLVVWLLVRAHGMAFAPDELFYVAPLRALVTHVPASDPALLLGLAYMLVIAWILAALSFRRAADADVSEWVAAAATAPIIQVPVILFLCILP